MQSLPRTCFGVVHTRGALLEETAYYPFGLEMKGISSKASSFGDPANKKKFNGYEENKDFDLNWLESYYRTYDPQLGRLWQIDPKPNEFESLYAGMGNNPVLKFDLLGDTTSYLNSNGDEIYRTNESKGNIISIIPDGKLGIFDYAVGLIDFFKIGRHSSIRATILQSIGESYDIGSMFAFFDSKKNDYWDEKTPTDLDDRKVFWKPIDGKEPLVREWSAAVEKKNNIWTVTESRDRGNPFACEKGAGPVTFHTHPSEGRTYLQTEVYTISSMSRERGAGSGLASTRADASSLIHGSGLYEIAVGSKVYFYNERGGVFAVDRNLIISKK